MSGRDLGEAQSHCRGSAALLVQSLALHAENHLLFARTIHPVSGGCHPRSQVAPVPHPTRPCTPQHCLAPHALQGPFPSHALPFATPPSRALCSLAHTHTCLNNPLHHPPPPPPPLLPSQHGAAPGAAGRVRHRPSGFRAAGAADHRGRGGRRAPGRRRISGTGGGCSGETQSQATDPTAGLSARFGRLATVIKLTHSTRDAHGASSSLTQ